MSSETEKVSNSNLSREEPAGKTPGTGSGSESVKGKSGFSAVRAAVRAVKWALLVFCLVWLYLKVDWRAAGAAIVALPVLPFLLVSLQRLVPYIGLGLRLNVITESKAGLLRCTQSEVLCLAFNSLLPARMGELVKILYLCASSKLEVLSLLGKVFFERLVDVTALFLIVFCAASFFLEREAVVAMLAALAVLWAVFAALMLSGKMGFLRKRLRRLMKLAEALRDALRPLMNRKSLGFVALWTAFIWLMNLTHLTLVCNWLFHFNLGVGGLGLVCAAVFMSSAFSAAPGGIGVMESAVVFVLSSMGKDAAQAAAAALVIRFLYIVPPVALSAVVIAASPDGASFLKDLRPRLKSMWNDIRQ